MTQAVIDTPHNPVTILDSIVIWAGSGTTNAPSLGANAVGVNQSGVYTGDVYLYYAATDTWNAMTGITTITLFGG